jgi:hypothetical protein
MNLYYDPILGIRYSFIENDTFYISVEALPGFNIEKWKTLVGDMGIVLIDSSQQPLIEEVPQITSYITI